MKKIETAETRTINAGCWYSGYSGEHKAIDLIDKRMVAYYTDIVHRVVLGWTIKTKYTWRCGCGQKFVTYFYS